MFDFNMDLKDNFAVFKEQNILSVINFQPLSVYIDSFDNKNFNIRYGNTQESQFLKTIHATSTEDLNQQLTQIFIDL